MTLETVVPLVNIARVIIYDHNREYKRGSITVPLTSCLTDLESAVKQLTFMFLFVKQTNPNQSNRRSMVQ